MEIKIDENGNEYARFAAKLMSYANQTRKNSNGTEYRVATIEYVNFDGELVTTNAMLYENNFKYGMEVGKVYLASAKPNDEGGVYLSISHLLHTERPTADSFGLNSIAETKVIEAAPTF